MNRAALAITALIAAAAPARADCDHLKWSVAKERAWFVASPARLPATGGSAEMGKGYALTLAKDVKLPVAPERAPGRGPVRRRGEPAEAGARPLSDHPVGGCVDRRRRERRDRQIRSTSPARRIARACARACGSTSPVPLWLRSATRRWTSSCSPFRLPISRQRKFQASAPPAGTSRGFTRFHPGIGKTRGFP